jgi:hypothetical protein
LGDFLVRRFPEPPAFLFIGRLGGKARHAPNPIRIISNGFDYADLPLFGVSAPRTWTA